MMLMMGFSKHKVFPIPSHVWGFETIGMRKNYIVGGGHGGGVNASLDGVIPTLILVLLWMNDSFSLPWVCYVRVSSFSMHGGQVHILL